MESGDNRSRTDRISELPGDILQKILSSVRIRAIVRMRRLSRKWRRLCESLQFIHLDCRDFKHWKVEKFARFVNNLLLVRRKVDLHTFQLHRDNGPLNFNDVRMWIGYAVKHNAEVLDVKLYHYDKHYLPPGIFTCRSLQELNLQWGESPVRLGDHTALEPPDIINLPSLKRLTLRDVAVSQRSLNRFIARSPALEDLHLIDCAEWVDCIASKSLKRLTLDGFTTGCFEFKICAPHLISFECKGYPLDVISWKDQPSIESVRIDCASDVEIISAFEGESNCTVVFPGVLAHAKRLALFGSDIKVMLEKELPTCSVFESLTALEIGDWYLFEDFVLRFLQLSPRLEKLTLMHSSDDKGADTDGMSIDGMTFQCPFLERVIVQCLKGDDGIDKLVNVLVVNGISADKISSITFHEDTKKREDVEGIRAYEEWSKELGIFEKMEEKNPEWIDDDPYATIDPDSEQGDAYDDEYVDDNF